MYIYLFEARMRRICAVNHKVKQRQHSCAAKTSGKVDMIAGQPAAHVTQACRATAQQATHSNHISRQKKGDASRLVLMPTATGEGEHRQAGRPVHNTGLRRQQPPQVVQGCKKGRAKALTLGNGSACHSDRCANYAISLCSPRRARSTKTAQSRTNPRSERHQRRESLAA